VSPVVLVSPPPEATGEARSLRWSRFRQAKTHSAFEVVDRGLGTLALVWQALWILGDRRMWPSATVNYAGVATPVLVVGAWLLLLAVHLLGWRAWWASARGLDVVALGVASAVALTHATATAPPDWGAASAFAVLSAGLAGLLFGARLATSWLLVVVIAECVVILGSPSGVSPLPTDVLYPAYAMTIGLITITARSVLLRDASRADSAAADLERAEQDRLTVEGVDSLLRAQERLLHDTVLNTLTAVLRGGLAASADLADRLRLRCRDSADVLRRLIEAPDDVLPLDPGGRWLDRDLAATLVELYSTGVQLHIDVGPLDRLPAPAYLALRTAAHEALVNVLRHADPANVWLEATAVDDRETSGALVRVRDDGRGFDPAVASTRDGLRGSVFESLAEVGGRARVESHPGGGTLVEMEWPAEVPSVSASAEPPAAGAFALPLLVIFGLFSTAIAVLTREDVNQPVLAALAWVLYIGLGILVAWSALRGPLPWWVVLTVAGVSPLVYQLQTQSAVSTHGPWTDWSSAAIAALFVVVASAGPGYAWLVLLITWLFIQGDIVHELLAEGTALILSAALFGRSTRRNAAAVERARAQEVAERAGESIAGQRRSNAAPVRRAGRVQGHRTPGRHRHRRTEP
jgi:signal transduction histidine kinase